MPSESKRATVLIVDDHPIYLDGISYMLQSVLAGVHILCAHSATEALQIAIESIELDWIFLDYQLPDDNGINLLRQFGENMITAPVVMMSGMDDVAVVAAALEAGANGFIHKTCSKATYQDCIAAIERGAIYLSAELTAAMEHYRRTVLKDKNRILEQLSTRRMDVLVCVAEGYSNGEMAGALKISEATVKAHVSALMTIFDADNRSHCVAEARKLGIIG